LLLEQKCRTESDIGHLVATESHERDNPGMEDLNVLLRALSDDEKSSVARQTSSIFPRRDSKEMAFFEAGRLGERMVSIGP